MSRFGGNPDEFLSVLKQYLAADVGEDYHDLKEVPRKLTEFEPPGHPYVSKEAVELLGTAVGNNKDWQTPFKQAGVLEYVLQQLDPLQTPIELATQYLRVIGNCVADNDDNRNAVLPSLEKLVDCLERRSLAPIALAVILNLCNDFEAGQNEAARLRLDSTICEYMVSNKIPPGGVDYAVDILTWTTTALSPSEIRDASSFKTLSQVLDLALSYDEEHYHDYVAVCLHYLQDSELQTKAARPEILGRVFDLLLDYEYRLQPEELQEAFQALNSHIDPSRLNPGGHDFVVTQLVNSLTAISATDDFVKLYTPRTPLIKKVESRLLSLAVTPSTVCACIMLGNIAVSNEVSINMVEDMSLHVTLIGILSARKEAALLYAAAGFIRHLAFPEENRRVLGEAGLIETCCHLLLNQDPAVRGEAAAIVCKLVTDNFENIEQIIYENMPEDITPAELPGATPPIHPTILYHIITQSQLPTTPLPSRSMKPATIELGRAIVAILRYLHRSDTSHDVEPVLRQMYKTPFVAKPLTQLFRQRFYAEARSEGLLGLGLMAQSHEGVMCIVDTIKEDGSLLDSLKEILEGKKEIQSQNAGHFTRDQQNALMLVHGLSQNGAHLMDSHMAEKVGAMRVTH
ncbi:ARM repeat-containing protein [Glonium stellatum]|uniref:ARM repeat-containing protein n=1 Tax=Glonium stellatum TaxID=574774 RepID=A0A8E2F195_9PEZI|nr:ARM repeat-containing protein [Glonium stellatum]